MVEEDQEIIDSLVKEINSLQQKNESLNVQLHRDAFVNKKDANLINVQLETDELLQKLEKFYKGEHLVIEGESVVWKRYDDINLIPLNDYGANFLMEIISKYIDKNTTLSNYKEERIYEILADIGDEMTLAIYCNYEQMGLDTAHKKSKFRLIVTTTLHLIESTYRRSIEGKTSEEVNQSKIVSQSDTLGRPLPVQQPQRKWNLGGLLPGGS